MPTTTVHATCLYCADEQACQIDARAWHDWTEEAIPADHALRNLDPDTRRWLTQQMCPACYQATITAAPADYIWEGACSGCGRWETFAVSCLALTAHRTGQLTDNAAFPNLTENQRCMIETLCHIDCYDAAVYGRPLGEPSPFARH